MMLQNLSYAFFSYVKEEKKKEKKKKGGGLVLSACALQTHPRLHFSQDLKTVARGRKEIAHSLKPKSAGGLRDSVR